MAVLEFKGITKRYGGAHALEDVSFDVVGPGVRAVVGANGAGKSTLMKILAGVAEKDSGSVTLDGKEMDLSSPHIAQKEGLGLVPQEISLCENLSVAENIFLGQEEPASSLGLVRYGSLEEKANQILGGLNPGFKSSLKAGELSVAQKQMVQIARTLAYGPRVLALDEPTSSLSDGEVHVLFRMLRKLVDQGIMILFISHKFKEIYEIADSASVLKDGKFVKTVPLMDTPEEKLLELMSAREIFSSSSRPILRQAQDERLLALSLSKGQGEPNSVLRVRNLSSGKKYGGISFAIHQGEILGFFGLVGAGRTEVARAIFGMDPYDAGEIFLSDRKIELRSPADAIRMGICLLPEDRKTQGLILQMSLEQNLTLPFLGSLSYAGFLLSGEEKTVSESIVEELSIRAKNSKQKVYELSGGNQQKAALGKWIHGRPSCLILDEPTKGVDVVSKSEIHQRIRSLAGKGTGVLAISSDLEELLEIAHRILVFRNGRIVKEFLQPDFSYDTIMSYAAIPRN